MQERIQERVRAWAQRPEVRERRRAYHRRPEVKERKRRPEVRAQQRAYRQRPDVKEAEAAAGSERAEAGLPPDMAPAAGCEGTNTGLLPAAGTSLPPAAGGEGA